jgi:glycine cleavage system H protein
MSEVPSELRYTKSHEWIRSMEDGHLEVGITDHAQEMLGDMVFIELPEVGSTVSVGDDCAVVESVKAASDIYAPVSGEIVEVNGLLEDSPENVNTGSYGDGWLFRMQPDDEGEVGELLDAEAYLEIIEAES